MADEKPDGAEGPETPEHTPAEAALERLLRERSPLLRRRQEVGAPDAAFVARLRAELVSAPPPALRAGRPRGRAWRGGRGRVVALAAALLVAVALTLVVLAQRHHAPPSPAVAWQPPTPSTAELSRGFPAPVVQHSAAPRDPTISLAAPPPGVPYAGRVTLSLAALPQQITHVLAYRLASPRTLARPPRVAGLARRLGIHAPVRPLTRGHTTWIVAAQGGASASQPLHSLAVSQTTGELVYHDAATLRRARQEVWHDNPTAVAAARQWLTRLGWPGTRMPLQTIAHSGLPRGVRSISFAWNGAGATATAAAILWVTPADHVVEADVWPPTESVRAIAAGRLAAAWAAVRTRLVPLAVAGVPPHTAAPGRGRIQRVTVTQVLSRGRDQRLYLVPTYRFSGTVQLHGRAGTLVCYALTPAAPR